MAGLVGSKGSPNFHNQYHGGIFRTRKLRDAMGPDDPLYPLLMTLCRRDIIYFFDEFEGAVKDDYWTATQTGSGTAFVEKTAGGSLNGQIRGTVTADNDDSRLLGEEMWTSDHRCCAIFRVYLDTAVTDTKFELGFIDGVQAGAVETKAAAAGTNATDFAVVIRDTEHNTSTDLITGSTDDGDTILASTPGITFTTQTWYDVMLAVNEEEEVAFWINSVFQGVIRTGPKNDLTTLALWAFLEGHGAEDRKLDIDYIMAWQERDRLPHSV